MFENELQASTLSQNDFRRRPHDGIADQMTTASSAFVIAQADVEMTRITCEEMLQASSLRWNAIRQCIIKPTQSPKSP